MDEPTVADHVRAATAPPSGLLRRGGAPPGPRARSCFQPAGRALLPRRVSSTAFKHLCSFDRGPPKTQLSTLYPTPLAAPAPRRASTLPARRRLRVGGACGGSEASAEGDASFRVPFAPVPLETKRKSIFKIDFTFEIEQTEMCLETFSMD